jgi:hypothetical protein
MLSKYYILALNYIFIIQECIIYLLHIYYFIYNHTMWRNLIIILCIKSLLRIFFENILVRHYYLTYTNHISLIDTIIYIKFDLCPTYYALPSTLSYSKNEVRSKRGQ